MLKMDYHSLHFVSLPSGPIPGLSRDVDDMDNDDDMDDDDDNYDDGDDYEAVKNEDGALVENDNEKARILKDFFSEKYNVTRIEPFTKKGELNNPITPEEVGKAVASLSNNKAPGPGGIQVELLKSAPPSVIEELAETFNNTFIQGQTTNIGNGTLILLH
ncbi:endonuclease-reverse transcriptase [Elysia marginata]|uniref:Endonuclease-reverse transcriptase n=1 Tax=Elysia marginata TaxID=1093978 RepID=A0AAV4H4A1_9GAST|nr:endonuclease-reverse transcriptase [Elysia marginata]